jgi:hypothetical protein
MVASMTSLPMAADVRRKVAGWGVEAEASARVARGQGRASEPLWRIKAREDQRLQRSATRQFGATSSHIPRAAVEAWAELASALSASEESRDRAMGSAVRGFVKAIDQQPQWPLATARVSAPERYVLGSELIVES